MQVGKPNVGENRPSRVRADISIELTVADTVKREWEGRKREVRICKQCLGIWTQYM